jgi:hypothetical protein
MACGFATRGLVVALVAHVNDAQAATGTERDRVAGVPAVDAEPDRRRAYAP